jgi:predicted amidohydrolase
MGKIIDGIIIEANLNKEEVITAELDLKTLKKKRKRGAAPTLKDRRVDIYNIQF